VAIVSLIGARYRDVEQVLRDLVELLLQRGLLLVSGGGGEQLVLERLLLPDQLLLLCIFFFSIYKINKSKIKSDSVQIK
jgi:hypothetical protein